MKKRMDSDPKIFMNEARNAFKEGDYSLALEKYEYFFDHALDNDPASYYGVRLSYCLDEWANLGEKYPKAKKKLEQKKENSLNLLKTEKAAEHFHDFISICNYLKCPEVPVEEFIKIHENDHELANKIVKFIWDALIKNELWDICSHYLADPLEKYSLSILKFDQAMIVCKSDDSLGGNDFEKQIKDWCIRDIVSILLVLKHSKNKSMLQEIVNLSKADLTDRSCEDIHDQILQNVAL